MKMQDALPGRPRCAGEWHRGFWRYPLILLALFAFNGSARAQGFLNVTNYGAKGDAVQFYASTVSNSVVITTTNLFSSADIGKTIEVFHCGNWHFGMNENGVVTNDNEDLVTTIANVVNGTNIYLAKPCLRSWNRTFATVGTDNTPFFEKAIAGASGYTNFTIQIPSGTFLLMPKFRSLNSGWRDNTFSSIYIQGGGIHFQGAGVTNTTLLGRGAWEWKTNLIGEQKVYHGVLVEVASIYLNPFTNDYPLAFSDLSMDGGVEIGRTTATGYPDNPVTGNGWAEVHSAYKLVGADNSSGRASFQTLSNVMFKHWRAEICISIDNYKNGKLVITNCTYTDGNATALNIYPLLDVGGCTFSNMNQVAELYQYWCNSGTNRFHDNLITNLSGNGFAWNGATGTNAWYEFTRNQVYFSLGGGACLETGPGANILIESNTVVMQGGNNTFLEVGTGIFAYQGYCNNSNIICRGNNVTAAGLHSVFLQVGGQAPSDCTAVQVYNNTITNFQFATYTFDTFTNVQFYSNTLNACGFYTESKTTPYLLIQTNNSWSGIPFWDETVGTNIVCYGGGMNGWYGPKVKFGGVRAVHCFQLDDTQPNRIPPGAVIEFDNTGNSYRENVNVLDSLAGQPVVVVVPFGQKQQFYWDYLHSHWSTNPPAGFVGSGTGQKTLQVPEIRVVGPTNN